MLYNLEYWKGGVLMERNKRIDIKSIFIMIIIAITLIALTSKPRLQKINFELQTNKIYINTEAQYEIQKQKAIEVNSNQ